MTRAGLAVRAGQSAVRLRDPLASDVDDRLSVGAPPPPDVRRRRPADRWPVPRTVRRLPPGWPIAAAVAGWPLWWALGVTNLVFPVFAVPLAVQLLRRGRVRVPAGFWMWGLFLVLVAVSGVAIDVDVAGTATPEGWGRYLAFVLRLCNYGAVTVMMLYVGNMSEEELPRRRIIRWMCSLGAATVLLGVLSLLLPDFRFTTPSAWFLPGGFRDEGSAVARLSQMQPILGDVSPRPTAPFAYTNAWGNNLSLLLVWLVVGWGVLGSRLRRLGLGALLLLAVPPILFSLNRGMWAGIAIAVVVVAARLALRGRVRVLAGLVLAASVGAAAFVATPAEEIVAARLATGHSNDVRASLLASAVDSARQSPVIGFGSTRKTVGSELSIAIGPSRACPRCGSRNIGSTGQLTLLLISQGFLGALLYFGFLGRSVLRYARDHSVLGIAGTLVVVLEIFYGSIYSALTMPLAITFISIGLLWRNHELREEAGRS